MLLIFVWEGSLQIFCGGRRIVQLIDIKCIYFTYARFSLCDHYYTEVVGIVEVKLYSAYWCPKN